MSVRLYSCLVIRNANGIFSAPYAIICCLLALQYFSTLCHKRHDYREQLYRAQNVFKFLFNFRLKYFSF